MSDTGRPGRPHEPAQYAIRVAGRLDQRWAEWFDGLTLTHQGDGSTVLQGPVADQPALHGLLHKIRDLGLPLLSVTPAPIDAIARTTTDDHTAEREADASTPTTTSGSSS